MRSWTRMAISVALTWPLAWPLAAPLAGCVPSDDETDAAVSPDAGPTVALVPGAVPLPCTFVRAATFQGDRLIVAARQRYVDEETGPASFCVSDDRARSFRVISVPDAELRGQEMYTVHLSGGRAWVLLADRVLAGTLERATTLVARELDVDAGTLGEPLALEPGAVHLGPDAIETLSLRDGTLRTAVLSVMSGEVSRMEAPASPEPCAAAQVPPFLSADGATFLRVCYRPLERCVQRAHVADARFEEACTPWASWPIPWWEGQRDEVLDGHVVRVTTERGAVRVRPLLDGPAPAVGDPIEVVRAASLLTTGSGLHDVLLVDDGTRHDVVPSRERLVTLREGRAIALGLPETACAQREDCFTSSDTPYAALRILLPMDRGEWLAVYDETSAGAFALVWAEGSSEPGPFVPPTDVAPGSGGLWVLTQPGDTELERTCARAIACPAGLALQIDHCIAYWSFVRGRDAAHDAAYERFVATPPGCDAFRETWPARFEGVCSPSCHPDGRAYVCRDEVIDFTRYMLIRECEPEGGVCRSDGATAGCTIEGASCDTCDASGHAIRCEAGAPVEVIDCVARGLECRMTASGPACADPTALGAAAICRGSVLTTFDPSGVVTSVQDCARAHLPCRADLGACTWEGVPGPCHTGDLASCDGSRMIWCSGGFYRFVDCLDLGASGCDAGRCMSP